MPFLLNGTHAYLLAYEGCSKSSELYLIGLSRNTFERQSIYNLKELYFSLKMMLISPPCIVLFNYISLTPYHWPVFMLYKYNHFLIWIFHAMHFYNHKIKLHCTYISVTLYNVHSNVRMVTGCADSIFRAQCTILMTSLKLITTHFKYIAGFSFLRTFYFCLFNWNQNMSISAKYLRPNK